MRLYILFILIMSLSKYSLLGQNKLKDYIKEGIASNHSLKQEQFLLEKSMLSLEEAKRLRQPNLNFSTTYTAGAGGRSIDFPIGDLLNDVYQTLNKLTQTQDFPQLKNQRVVLNPYNFYDAKVRTTMPLINAEISINQKVKAQAIPIKQAEINVYKRELVKEIKIAYFRFLQASQGVEIYENGLKLLNELRRVNQSLVNNGVATPTATIKANSEILKLDAQLQEAKNNQKNAAAYFNFLINKDLQSNIDVDTLYLSHLYQFDKDLKVDVKNREELQKLQAAAKLADLGLAYQKTYFKPKLGLFLDIGSQGFIDVRGQSAYVFGGLSFEYPLYDGKRNKLRQQQVQADINALKEQTQLVDNQLELQLSVAVNSYLSALGIYENSIGQIQLTQRYYSDIFKKYKEGQALLIELLEAQTQMLNAELQRSIALSNVWIKLTEIERVSAGYEF